MNENVIPHQHRIGLEQRMRNLNQQPVVVWFTGLSGSGKSTLADALETELNKKGFATMLLDGDNIRSGINNDLGFSEQDRKENIRRLSEIVKLFHDAGIVVLTAFISPFISDRETIRTKLPTGRFVEVFVDTPLEICEQRDTKGLYAKARKGEIKNFTGIDSLFEKPLTPEITIPTAELSIEESLNQLLKVILPLIERKDR
jgi:adenylylsulfate kinase